uniref:Uncharacterized protein n=1 Tax=Mus musculus TaxID=10090 RepID=Q3UPZ7_MOUSE|nr:unnamed protein product [Mus musculus]
MGYFLFLLLLLFWFFFCLFLIYDNSTLGPSCHSLPCPSPWLPDQAQQHIESWVPGTLPTSTLQPVLHWLWLRPRAPPLPSCPMEQPGCSKGARRAWLGSQDKGSGARTPRPRWPLPA